MGPTPDRRSELARSARLALALSILFSIGCRRGGPAASPAPDPNQVIATWSGGRFTRAEIEPLVQKRLSRQQASSPEARATTLKSVLERRVRMQLIYRDAIATGVHDRPEVKALLRAVEEKVFAEDWLSRHVTRDARAAEPRVDEEVRRVAAQASGHELRQFSNIFLRAPEADAEARARARARMAEIRRELADGTAFEELARKYSDSITARGGGQVQWTPREPLQEAVAEAVFSLAEGQTSEPVETELGLHLFRLDGIRRPSPPDIKAVRTDVKQRLDIEAAEAAAVAERDRTFDASGIRLDAQALSRPGPPDQVVAVMAGQTLRREELDSLRELFDTPEAHRPPQEFARWLLTNRILAERRRTEGIDAELNEKLDDARFLAIFDVRKDELMSAIPKEISPRELAEFYERYRDNTPVLRDHVIDLLFFPQKGPAAAEVYAKGESVAAALRDGKSFDRLLEEHGREPGVVVRRRLAAGDVPSLRSQSLRLGGTVGRLGVGEVSAPIYIDADVVRIQGKPVLSGKGLAFVRLVEVRPQPLEAVRDRVREALARQKQSEGLNAIFKRLDEQAGLKILVPTL
jgi:parvulin-like peptidyl-prolyl isomerase